MKVRYGVVAKRPSGRGSPSPFGRNGGRAWWAHFEFTRINIELTILPKKIEEQLILSSRRSPNRCAITTLLVQAPLSSQRFAETQDPKLVAALGARPHFVAAARDFMCVFENEDQVRALTPNMEKLAALDRFACIVTAPGRDCDFVSRFFAPARGVPEDPVTGSSHCTLIPYWSKRLGKTKLFARQLSRRGGELWCEDRGERVKIAGRAVKFLEGSLEVRQQIASTAS